MAIDYKKEGRIAIFTINRPEVMNAMNVQAIQELHEAMVDFRDDSELWVGIITGAGDKAFSAGADIQQLGAAPKEGEASIKKWTTIPSIVRGLDIWKPLIAAINGWALGAGLELALACDIRIAAEHARLGTPEVTHGLIPGDGGTQRLPRMLPWCKAAEILIMGRPIDAQEAYRIGLVNKVVPLEQLMPTAKEWAQVICQSAPLAVRAAKEAMIRGYSMTLEDGLRLEESLEDSLHGTEDYTEGTRAFVEKRKPVYKAK